ncbi:TPA: hypothetical protein ROY24_004452 [Bacillus cereus]|nr:hypothetical protein CN338_06590 [Bacillus cereus]HDX9671330.1 hypothetical protein [Bacillus cereus]
MNYSKWKNKKVNVLDIKLDELNPRVFVNNPTQQNIRNYLIEHFNVIDLANDINKNNGLPPTESILCIEENQKLIVVEGNRRISACHVLLDPSLLPNMYRSKINPTVEIRQQLLNLNIYIAPSREEAEPYITLRHSDYGIKKWSMLAQHRRVMTRYQKKQSTKQIANLLEIKESEVKKTIQFYYFFEYIKNNLKWTETEKKIIFNPLLELSKIERFLPFSKKAKEILKINFNENHQLIINPINKEIFNRALQIIVRKIFITEEYNTRTSHKLVFNKEIEEICSKLQENIVIKNHSNNNNNNEQITLFNIEKTENKKIAPTDSVPIKNVLTNKEPVDKTLSIKNKYTKNTTTDSISVKNESSLNTFPVKNDYTKSTSTNSVNSNQKEIIKQPKPKERKFLFEGLKYTGQHIGIQRSLYEIQNINYDKYPLSITYLLRTLLECSLQEYLVKNNLFEEWKKKNQDPSITDLLNYCNQHKCLKKTNTNHQRTIEVAIAKRDHDELNSVTHAKYNEPSVNSIKDIEKRWYQLVKFLLENC